jgi:hypothetical protein
VRVREVPIEAGREDGGQAATKMTEEGEDKADRMSDQKEGRRTYGGEAGRMRGGGSDPNGRSKVTEGEEGRRR